MKLSTTLIPVKCIGKPGYTFEDMIRDTVEAGFTVLDFPFHSKMATFLNDGEDWKTPMKEYRALAESLGARFRYAHIPFGYPPADDKEAWALFNRRCGRALQAAAELGVEWAVAHPYDMAAPLYDEKAALDRALGYLTPLAHIAVESGVGMAIENMVDRVLVPFRRYCSTAENLRTVIDSVRVTVSDPGRIGACLDTGHANACGLDHYAAVKVLGSRLKMLHVNDNGGLADDHIPPFTGTVHWDRLMQGLKEIGFPGDLNYEVRSSTIPGDAVEARVAYVAYLQAIGKYMISLFGA